MKVPDQIRIFSAIARELAKQGFKQPITNESANALLAAANIVVEAFTIKGEKEGE